MGAEAESSSPVKYLAELPEPSFHEVIFSQSSPRDRLEASARLRDADDSIRDLENQRKVVNLCQVFGYEPDGLFCYHPLQMVETPEINWRGVSA